MGLAFGIKSSEIGKDGPGETGYTGYAYLRIACTSW
jgi:hypothetical protein